LTQNKYSGIKPHCPAIYINNKKMKKTLVYLALAILLLSTQNLYAAGKRELFRGGMLLHVGHLQNKIDYPQINGFTKGIGGKIAFRIGPHFRAGTEGYVSTYKYKNNEGNYKVGWGGLLFEYQFLNKRFTPVAGFSIGKGSIHDLYMIEGNYTDNEPDTGIYKTYSSTTIDPHISLEYQIADNINIIGKIDYLLFPGIEYPKQIARGPRFYFGILFMR
jgi:hypothetical protein